MAFVSKHWGNSFQLSRTPVQGVDGLPRDAEAGSKVLRLPDNVVRDLAVLAENRFGELKVELVVAQRKEVGRRLPHGHLASAGIMSFRHCRWCFGDSRIC